MPILKVCSVRDRAADVFGRPFFTPSRGVAVRSFTDHINSKDDSEMVKHPSDFELYQLADFDDETGKFENLEAPKMLARGEDVKTEVVK